MYTTKAQICIRRDTAANFTSANPTLALGEIAYETDTRNIKVGDGATAWTALGYINPYRGGTAAAPTSNTVLGSGAGAALQSGAADNVLIGRIAGDAITTGDDNVAIGTGAFGAGTTQQYTVAIGRNALSLTSGAGADANVAIGFAALESNVNGGGAVAVGTSALRNFVPTTTSTNVVAVGASALNQLTTGLNSVAVGQSASGSQTTASHTTAVGNFALLRNLSADNSAFGSSALQNNTLGTQNSGIGRFALAAATTQAATVTISAAGTGGTPGTYSAVQLTYVSGATAVTYPTADIVVGAGGDVTSVTIVSGGNAFTATSGTVMTAASGSIGNTTGFTCTLATVATAASNTAVGHNAGLLLTTGTGNTLVGAIAGDAVTTATNNTAVGNNALGSNTTGASNSAVGTSVLSTNSTGTANTAIGESAGLANSTGNNNVFVGRAAMSNNGVGSNNTAVGMQAGRFRGSGTDTLTVATSSVFIGYQSRAAADSETNQVVIAGVDGLGNGSNTTTIGNSSTTGTFIPAGNLSVQSGIVEAIQTAGNNSGRGVFARNSTQSQSVGLVPAAGNDGSSFVGTTTNNQLQIRTNTTTRMTVGTDGNVSIANGNLVMSTAGTGIDFSATANSSGTMTSELLNDYEEGTWTPVYSPATGSFTTLTMDVPFAHYTKIGRLVTVYGNMRTDNVDATGASGGLRISGLPFAIGNSRSAGGISGASGFAGDVPLNIFCVNTESVLRLSYRTAVNGADVELDVSDLTTGAVANQNNIYFVATYQV